MKLLDPPQDFQRRVSAVGRNPRPAAGSTIEGTEVFFDRPCDWINLCCQKSRFGKIGPGGALLCANCNAPRSSLPPSVQAQLTDIVTRFGPLDAPIILRAGGRK
jgi:hypothetical protein